MANMRAKLNIRGGMSQYMKAWWYVARSPTKYAQHPMKLSYLRNQLLRCFSISKQRARKQQISLLNYPDHHPVTHRISGPASLGSTASICFVNSCYPFAFMNTISANE